MDQTTLSQVIDFQEIAVNQLEKENPETAQDFAQEVLAMLQSEYEARDDT